MTVFYYFSVQIEKLYLEVAGIKCVLYLKMGFIKSPLSARQALAKGLPSRMINKQSEVHKKSFICG
jgi:hypothetical protein